MVLVVGFLVGWGGGEGVGVDGVDWGGVFSSSFMYFALNSYFLGFFKMLTAIISFFVYFVGFHYDFCIFCSRKEKEMEKTFFLSHLSQRYL